MVKCEIGGRGTVGWKWHHWLVDGTTGNDEFCWVQE